MIPGMAIRQANPGAGRPSKGDRHAMMTRLPRPVADRVMRLAAQLDLSYSDTLALLVDIGLDSDRLPGHLKKELSESA